MTVFPAKLLLFGEYSILLGSSALGMPFNYFGASLKFITPETGETLLRANESNLQLKGMYDYFHVDPVVFNKFIDLAHFYNDICNGLYLASTIPQRYGMGSSGALCAAVFDRYKVEAHDPWRPGDVEGLISMRQSFVQMESFFHGKSSGFDPLVSSLNMPLLLGKDGQVVPAGLRKCPLEGSNLHVLLVDSGQPCSTGPLVNNFLSDFAPGGRITPLGTTFCKLADTAIENLFSNNMDGLWGEIILLSRFQLENLSHLVPAGLRNIWADGLKTGLFTLKLCGSGGGGFLLCFTRQKRMTHDYFKTIGLPVIPVSNDF